MSVTHFIDWCDSAWIPGNLYPIHGYMIYAATNHVESWSAAFTCTVKSWNKGIQPFYLQISRKPKLWKHDDCMCLLVSVGVLICSSVSVCVCARVRVCVALALMPKWLLAFRSQRNMHRSECVSWMESARLTCNIVYYVWMRTSLHDLLLLLWHRYISQHIYVWLQSAKHVWLQQKIGQLSNTTAEDNDLYG